MRPHWNYGDKKIYDMIYDLLLENFKEAVPIYEKLLKRNQENFLYFDNSKPGNRASSDIRPRI